MKLSEIDQSGRLTDQSLLLTEAPAGFLKRAKTAIKRHMPFAPQMRARGQGEAIIHTGANQLGKAFHRWAGMVGVSAHEVSESDLLLFFQQTGYEESAKEAIKKLFPTHTANRKDMPELIFNKREAENLILLTVQIAFKNKPKEAAEKISGGEVGKLMMNFIQQQQEKGGSSKKPRITRIHVGGKGDDDDFYRDYYYRHRGGVGHRTIDIEDVPEETHSKEEVIHELEHFIETSTDIEADLKKEMLDTIRSYNGYSDND